MIESFPPEFAMFAPDSTRGMARRSCGRHGLAIDPRRFSVVVDTGKGDGVRRWADHWFC
jgi:hypothetical protein